MLRSSLVALVLSSVLSAPHVAAQDAIPIAVCATTPNAGALVRAVGGDAVALEVFSQPMQDPHFLRAVPSMVRKLRDAELLVLVGLELEAAWLGALIDGARNPRVRANGVGYLDLSRTIRPIQVSAADRSSGDVHPLGNPHYLVDPIAGMTAARAIAQKLGTLRPELAAQFSANADALVSSLGELLFGAELVARFPPEKLGVLVANEKLATFLANLEDAPKLGGKLGALTNHRKKRIVCDHDGWRYLLRTTGLITAGFLEPYPSVAPSTGHLGRLVDQLRAEPAAALVHAPYFETSAVEFVHSKTDIPVVRLAHQVGALGADADYVAFVTRNLDALIAALGDA